jgi:TPR repeat protein
MIDDNAGEPDTARLRSAYDLLHQQNPTAIVELKALAASSSPLAMLYLGCAYYEGCHLKKDLGEAKIWFAKMAELNDPRGAYLLGRVCEDLGDWEGAASAYEAGNRLHHQPSTYRLAQLARIGKGMAPNAERYIELLSDSADRGHIFSRRDLGSAYLSGRYGAKKFLVGLYYLSTLPLAIIRILRRLNKPLALDDVTILA